jgi:hypothetical protein
VCTRSLHTLSVLNYVAYLCSKSNFANSN